MTKKITDENPMPKKLRRPKVTSGETERVETGCGHLYITLGRHNGHLVEILATLGKAGGCALAQNEGMTRAISLGLKYGVPIKGYVKQLENIQCPSPGLDEGVRILSCADAIAKILKKEVEKEEESGNS